MYQGWTMAQEVNEVIFKLNEEEMGKKKLEKEDVLYWEKFDEQSGFASVQHWNISMFYSFQSNPTPYFFIPFTHSATCSFSIFYLQCSAHYILGTQ